MFKHKTKGWFKSMSLILIFILSISQFTLAEGYKDIESHWSKPYVTQGIEEGWIKGYEDETIRPNDKITRSEFISILSRIHLSIQTWIQRLGLNQVSSLLNLLDF